MLPEFPLPCRDFEPDELFLTSFWLFILSTLLVFTSPGASAFGSSFHVIDGMLLAMCFPNLIGVYFLLPVVKQELTAFHAHATAIDAEELSKG